MVLWSSLVGMLPFHWAEFGFMQMALLAVLVVAPLFAFLGCMVVNNQMAFFSDAIGHSALTGIAIGVILGVVNPVWSMTLFSLCLAVGITLLRKYGTASADTIIGIVMSFTVATGIVILSRGGGFSRYSRYWRPFEHHSRRNRITGPCGSPFPFTLGAFLQQNLSRIDQYVACPKSQNSGVALSNSICNCNGDDCNSEYPVGRHSRH